jgi:hypothetical protein
MTNRITSQIKKVKKNIVTDERIHIRKIIYLLMKTICDFKERKISVARIDSFTK